MTEASGKHPQPPSSNDEWLCKAKQSFLPKPSTGLDFSRGTTDTPVTMAGSRAAFAPTPTNQARNRPATASTAHRGQTNAYVGGKITHISSIPGTATKDAGVSTGARTSAFAAPPMIVPTASTTAVPVTSGGGATYGGYTDTLTASLAELLGLVAQHAQTVASHTPQKKKKKPLMSQQPQAAAAWVAWDICPYRNCVTSFENVQACEHHLSQVHLKQEMEEALSKQQKRRGLDPRGMECPERDCGYIAPLRTDLTRHFRSVHLGLRTYLRQNANSIPGANFDQLRASGYFKRRKPRRQELVDCPDCATMVAVKHETEHMIYKHFWDFYEHKIRTEQADFGVEPGHCPIMNCDKIFKTKKSQTDLLMKHYVKCHFSIELARTVCQPVIPPPFIELEEEENLPLPKKEEPDSMMGAGDQEQLIIGCPYSKSDKGCEAQFHINTEGYLAKIWNHLLVHSPGQDLAVVAVQAACGANTVLASDQCPLDYCRSEQINLVDHFVNWHFFELILTALVLHCRASTLLTALLRNLPHKVYQYFKKLKRSLAVGPKDMVTEAVESTPDIGTLFPDIKVESEQQPEEEQQQEDDKKEQELVIENSFHLDEVISKDPKITGSSSLAASLLADKVPDKDPPVTLEKIQPKKASRNLSGSKSDANPPSVGAGLVVDSLAVPAVEAKTTSSTEMTSSVLPPALRQYLTSHPNRYSELFLSTEGRTLPEPLLQDLQADLLTGRAGVSTSQIQEIMTFLGCTVSSVTTAAGDARPPPIRNIFAPIGRHAGLLADLYARHRHLAQAASQAAHAMVDQIRATEAVSNNETDHLVEVVWSLLFRRPPGSHRRAAQDVSHGVRAGWECGGSCASAFPPVAVGSVAEHCFQVGHVSVTCNICTEEVALPSSPAVPLLEELQVRRISAVNVSLRKKSLRLFLIPVLAFFQNFDQKRIKVKV